MTEAEAIVKPIFIVMGFFDLNNSLKQYDISYYYTFKQINNFDKVKVVYPWYNSNYNLAVKRGMRYPSDYYRL